MSGLIEQLMKALGPEVVQQVAGKLGTTPQQAQGALVAALPVLLGALQRNASTPDGADALRGALQRNHASVDLGGVMGAVLSGQRTDGAAILGHVLGARVPRAAQGIGAASGLSGGQSQDLMAMLAPLVMGALGQQGAAAGGSPLSSMLDGATRQLDAEGGGVGARLVAAVLDRDGDGDVDFSDLAAMAAGREGQGGAGGLGGLLDGLLGKGR
jgi:hypothetical protein